MLIVAGSVVAFLATLHVVSTQSIHTLCEECTIVNGAGFRGLPSDCTKYLRCELDVNGNLHGTVQKCAFPTYWDDTVLTCREIKDVTCPNDMCNGQAGGVLFDSESNCRGYWECKYGKARPRCCGDGQYYFNSTVGCIDIDPSNNETECLKYCFNAENEPKNVTCDKRPLPGNPAFFQQQVHKIYWVTMPCATGTNYVQDKCGCESIVAPVPVQKVTCKPELHLPFTTNHLDESGNGFYIKNENVHVANGVAKFNGINSRLIIPRFTNLEHSETVVIKIKYASNHKNIAAIETRAIVSNSDCGNLPSILISENSELTRFAIGTSMEELVSAYLPQNQTTYVKDLVYDFNDGYMAGINGGDFARVQAPGYLKNVQCALHVGHMQSELQLTNPQQFGFGKIRPFEGEIDEITVYLCNPDNI